MVGDVSDDDAAVLRDDPVDTQRIELDHGGLQLDLIP